MFRYLLARPQRRSHLVAQVLMTSNEAQDQHRDVSHDPAGPFHPLWFLPLTGTANFPLGIKAALFIFVILPCLGTGDFNPLRKSQPNSGRFLVFAPIPAKAPFFVVLGS